VEIRLAMRVVSQNRPVMFHCRGMILLSI